MTTTLELHAAIDRVRLVRAGFDRKEVYGNTYAPFAFAKEEADKLKIADAYLDQLDRDALEAATPCPDCDVIDEQRGAYLWLVLVRNGVLSITQTASTGTDETHHDCKTAADLRRWCAAIKVEMPDVGGRR